MKFLLYMCVQRVQELEEELSQATAAAGELEQKLDRREEEFQETATRLKEVDKLWSETQSTLEKEQSLNVELEQEKGVALLDQKKVS